MASWWRFPDYTPRVVTADDLRNGTAPLRITTTTWFWFTAPDNHPAPTPVLHGQADVRTGCYPTYVAVHTALRPPQPAVPHCHLTLVHPTPHPAVPGYYLCSLHVLHGYSCVLPQPMWTATTFPHTCPLHSSLRFWTTTVWFPTHYPAVLPHTHSGWLQAHTRWFWQWPRSAAAYSTERRLDVKSGYGR